MKLAMNFRMTVLSLAATGLCAAWIAQTPARAVAGAGASWDYTPLGRVADKARARQNPFANDPNAVAAGKKLFMRHCAECHGENLEGSKRGINLMSEDLRQASPGALFWVITNGVVRHGMPVWSKLPEPQRWQIVSFLESVGAPASDASTWDYTPLERVAEKERSARNPFEGDAEAVAAGKKLFAQHCVACHGENLEGGKRGISLMSEEVRQASPGALFRVITNGVVPRGMPAWFKLPEPNRWQIISFLKSAGTPTAEESTPRSEGP